MLHKMVRALVLGGGQVLGDTVKEGVNLHREKRYFEIDAVEIGATGDRALNSKCYDMVFVDVDGAEARATLESIRKTQSVKTMVVALATSMEPDLGQALKEAGVYSCLGKPFHKDNVSSLVATSMVMTTPCPILIVDDSGAMRKITRKILNESRFSFEIAECDSAEAAIRMVSTGRYKIVLTDFHMPGSDGLELAGSIREMSNKIGVYMMSTNDTSYLERSAAFIGISGFLQKPFGAKDIDAVMHEYFGMPKPLFSKKREMFRFETREKKAS